MGGTDIGLAASVSSSANSGLEDNSRYDGGDNIAGGMKIPQWALLAALGAALLVAVGWILK